MIYIKDHGLIFIHIPKTAGSSITQGMIRTIDYPLPISLGRKRVTPKTHAAASVVKNHLGPEEWDRCWSFAVVRNPWDRILSKYFYYLSVGTTTLSFRNWMLSDPIFQTQCFYVLDSDGAKLVTTIFRFEFLERVPFAIEKHIGMRFHMLDIKKAAGRKHYRKYYTDKTRKYVQDRYAEDIERFEYQF